MVDIRDARRQLASTTLPLDPAARADAIGQSLVDACDAFETSVGVLATVVDVAATAAIEARRDRDTRQSDAGARSLASVIKQLAEAIEHNSAAVARLTERIDALEQRAAAVRV